MEPIPVDQRAEERDAHEGSEQIELSKQYGGGVCFDVCVWF